MRFDAFIGGSYESQAVTADEEKTVNWYPEMLESKGASSQAVLYPTPGVAVLSSVSVGNGRAHLAINSREFAVIGGTFYEIDSAGVAVPRGTVALDSSPATISSNGEGGNQLFITSGRNGYVYDLSLNSLVQIPALSGKANQGDFIDGYFLALDSTSATLYVSKLLDGTSWSPGTDFAQRSLAPDRWVAMRVVGRYIWLFGTQTTEIWYDTGGLFPFAPHPSGLLNFGCAAPFSTQIIGSDIIWLGSTKTGRTCVLRGSGFTPAIISSHPLETALQDYTAVSAAVGDVYSEKGHTFYLISFDQNNVTWAYDAETQLWCERGTWLSEENRFTSWRPRFYAWAYNQHRILDASGGSIFRMSSDYTTDVDGLFIRRLRRAPAIIAENKRVYYSSFEVIVEPVGDPKTTVAAFTMVRQEPV